MKEINEIIRHLKLELNIAKEDGKDYSAMKLQDQVDNANKVAAKLQGAIDLFKEIEEI
tara:strand:+ start:278 stop:451 length:174 start_codon:yes stop_codon:yes gene_type:complete